MAGADLEALDPEWGDDQRMRVMLAPLRSRELNPESWEAKVLFWTGLIQRWAEAVGKTTVTVQELEVAFTRNGQVPHCIFDIVQAAVTRGDLQTRERYLASLQPAAGSWAGWLAGLSWSAVQAVGDRLLPGLVTPDTSLVVPGVAKTASQKLLTRLQAYPVLLRQGDALYLAGQEVEEVEKQQRDTLEMLLASRQVAATSHAGQNIFKVSSDGSPVVFSETDRGIVKTKMALGGLEREVDQLEAGVAGQRARVKQLLQAGSRQSAKTELKRQKLLEKNLEQKLEQKLNLETMLDEILSANSNKAVASAYKTGLDTLKDTLQDESFKDLDDVMDELGEVLNSGEDMSAIIARPVQEDTLDQEELEAELSSLVAGAGAREGSAVSAEDEELLAALERLGTADDLSPTSRPRPGAAKQPSAHVH